MDTEDFAAALREAWKKEKLGRFNLAVVGKTGVGKSTLINAIFGRDVAETGVGKPVTADSTLHLDSEGVFGFYDTRGLEVGPDSEAIIGELRDLVSHDKPLESRVHALWYCVNAQGSRIEKSEIDFLRHLAILDVPVILVLTRATMRQSRFHPTVDSLMQFARDEALPVVDGIAFPVMAADDDFDDVASHGLQALLDVTRRVVPKAVEQAVIAAQHIDLKAKKSLVDQAITVAGGAAGATALSPIPFSSAAILVPIQTGLMMRIAKIYGVPVDTALVSAMAATSASTAVGRTIAANLLKFIPGLGTLAGGAINATVATSMTVALGYSWQSICHRHASGDIDLETLPAEELASIFRSGLSGKL